MITEKEFTNIYNRIASKVQRLCIGYASGDEFLAKEWVQETFIKVWNHRNSFKGESSIDTWIFRIAVNVCLSNLRKHKINVPISDNILATTKTENSNEENDINIQKMYQCIEQLSEQNKVLILLELEDIPQNTIAETLGLAHGTIRTRLRRIKKLLLKCITNGK